MNPQERFVSYLEEHPGFYLVAKSDLYINFLSIIEKEGKDIESLKKVMPGIEQGDIQLVLNSLISLKLVGLLKTNSKIIYFATDAAREFLSLYRNTKTGFGPI